MKTFKGTRICTVKERRAFTVEAETEKEAKMLIEGGKFLDFDYEELCILRSGYLQMKEISP